MSITVYTVIVGDQDTLHRPKVIEPGIRYVCFSDRKWVCPPWEVESAPLPGDDPRRNSRLPKILSHSFFNSEYTIYHDGSCVTAAKPSDLIKELLMDTDLAMYRHPRRGSLYEEREACIRLGVCNGKEIDDQVERYKRRGIGQGLWSGGVILRRNTSEVRMFNLMWWLEYCNGCVRDQISLPYAIQESGIRVNTLQENITDDPERFHFHYHIRQPGILPELFTGLKGVGVV